jgi:sugar phosphate isomerase/epimerase
MKLELGDPRETGIDHLAPGSGILDWGEILVALDSVGYTGPLNLDAIVPYGEVADAYMSGLQHIREVQRSGVGRGHDG